MLVTNFLWRAQTGTRQQEVNKSDRTRDWREGLDHKRKPRSRVIAEGGSRAEGRCFQEKKKNQKWQILIRIEVYEWVKRSSGFPRGAVVKNLPAKVGDAEEVDSVPDYQHPWKFVRIAKPQVPPCCCCCCQVTSIVSDSV